MLQNKDIIKEMNQIKVIAGMEDFSKNF